MDSSFMSNSSERHPKGKRKRTAYVVLFLLSLGNHTELHIHTHTPYFTLAHVYKRKEEGKRRTRIANSPAYLSLKCERQSDTRIRVQCQPKTRQSSASRYRQARVSQREGSPGTSPCLQYASSRKSRRAQNTNLYMHPHYVHYVHVPCTHKVKQTFSC